jgi:TolB protein
MYPKGLPMKLPRRPQLLKLVAFLVLAAASLLSVARTHQPASSAPETKEPPSLRAVGAMQPRLSPDGKDIAFSYHGAIWRIPAEGGVMRRLAAGPGLAVEPCWSPDGKQIAFLQGRTWGSGTVKLIDAQTGKAVPLKDNFLGSGKLAFSADARRLLGNLRGEKQPDAFRWLDLQTGELTTVLRVKSPRQPWALSADGKWVALVTNMDVAEQQGGNDGPEAEVWKLSADGSEPTKLFRFPARIHDLCWAADGRALFVSTELGGVHNDLYRIDLASPERPTKLTFGQADEDRPSLSGAGRRLVYVDNNEGCPALMVRDLETGATRPVTIGGLDFAAATGKVQLHITDRRQPIVARVSLEHKDGSSQAPPGSIWRVYRGQGFWYVDGAAEFELPAGSYRLRALQGPETRPALLEFEVQPGKTSEQTVTIDRWADARGWYAGDNHIHANYGYGEYYNTPATMALMGAGEGLNICNFMVANSDGDGVFDREFFRGQPDPLSTSRTVLYWNEEFRSTIWGHMTLVNLKHVVEPVFTGFARTTNPYDVPTNAGIADRTHRQGGLVNYTHPSARIDDLYRGAYTAKGLPVDVALGKIDTMDVMGINEQASTALYHRLLNCGFRLTASAGTDCFLNRVNAYSVPGSARVYVKVDGALTYARWINGLRAGRSFVSNGPMLELTVDGKGAGDTLELRAASEVKIQATARSQYPLTALELLHNGKVVASATPAKDVLTTELAQAVRLEKSGWLALRALGPAQFDTRGDPLMAHTSPVYVVVGTKPAGSAADARYFLEWMDKLEAALRDRDRLPDAAAWAAVAAQLNQARAVYQKMIARE